MLKRLLLITLAALLAAAGAFGATAWKPASASALGVTVGPVTFGTGTGLGGSGNGAGSGGGNSSVVPTAPGPAGFNFSQAGFSVAQNVGKALITVQRGGQLPAAQVRYHTPPLAQQTALPVVDYTPVNGVLDFAAGQASASFEVPIVDLGLPGLPSTSFYVALYGASGTPLGGQSQATVSIVDTDTNLLTRILGDPLGLFSTQTSQAQTSQATQTSQPKPADPLTGVQTFVDRQWGTAAREAAAHPAQAPELNVIAGEPVVTRFVASNTQGGADVAVSRFLQRARAAEPGTVPEISTYDLNHSEACATDYTGPGSGRYSDSAAQAQAYKNWIHSVASGISGNRAIVFLEIDALITTPCLSHHGLSVRVGELRYAINQLAALPRTAVYVDAGAADALTARQAAKLLNEIGVRKIQGFFLNATHYDWTKHEIAYGEKISKLAGGAHFVVNTAVNGRGPLKPRNSVRDGNEVRCNPAGRGLGPKPTFATGYRNVDAFAWIGNPGLSTGTCGDPSRNPPTGVFDMSYALSLIRNADFAVR